MATLTVYESTANTCGYIQSSGSKATFATLRGASTGTALGTLMYHFAYLFSDSKTDTYQAMQRGTLSFDTSALTTGATISAATVSLYGVQSTNTLGTPTGYITNVSPLSTAAPLFVLNDYNNIVDTSLTTTNYTYAGWSNSTYNTLTLTTAAGFSAINTTGYTQLMFRTGWDFSNTAPAYVKSVGSWLAAISPAAAGNNPYLYITYAAGGTAHALESVVNAAATGALVMNYNAAEWNRPACTAGTSLGGSFNASMSAYPACNAGTTLTLFLENGVAINISGVGALIADLSVSAAPIGNVYEIEAEINGVATHLFSLSPDYAMQGTVAAVSSAISNLHPGYALVVSTAAAGGVNVALIKDTTLGVGEITLASSIVIAARADYGVSVSCVPTANIITAASVDYSNVVTANALSGTAAPVLADYGIGLLAGPIAGISPALAGEYGVSLLIIPAAGVSAPLAGEYGASSLITPAANIALPLAGDYGASSLVSPTASVDVGAVVDVGLSDTIDGQSGTVFTLEQGHVLAVCIDGQVASVFSLDQQHQLGFEAAGLTGTELVLTKPQYLTITIGGVAGTKFTISVENPDSRARRIYWYNNHNIPLTPRCGTLKRTPGRFHH